VGFVFGFVVFCYKRKILIHGVYLFHQLKLIATFSPISLNYVAVYGRHQVWTLCISICLIVAGFFEFDQKTVKCRGYDPGNGRNPNRTRGNLKRRFYNGRMVLWEGAMEGKDLAVEAFLEGSPGGSAEVFVDLFGGFVFEGGEVFVEAVEAAGYASLELEGALGAADLVDLF
jgi:hypothetical protein